MPESLELIRAIRLIRQANYAQAADKLEEMMSRGVLKIDDQMPYGFWGETDYPVFGNQTIRLSVLGVPNRSAHRNAAIVLFEDRVWFASILAHEYFHTQQDPIWIRIFGRNESAREKPAWTYQRDFLRRILWQIKDDTAKKSRIENLIDRTQAEINEL